MRLSLARIVRTKTDLDIGAKTACGHIYESVTRKRGRA
jgi:hypothetical protein